MLRRMAQGRDFYAGLLMMLIGSVAALEGMTYRVGGLTRMGPGFMPVALGVLLGCLGILIAGGAMMSGRPGERILPEKPEWAGWLCIVAGPALFIVLGERCGLVPATFGCVFVSALGDRSASWRGAFALACGATVFGVVLFKLLLMVPLPLLRWPLS